MKKYFLIFYTGMNDKGQIFGNCAFQYNGIYPGRKFLENYMKDNFSMLSFTVTNIIELTGEEFDAWSNN